MFAGHFGAAFAAKRLAPRLNLGVLFGAALAIDVVWSVLVIAGVERYHIDAGLRGIVPSVNDFMPYSHSLLAAVVWAGVFAALFARQNFVAAGITVVSHWVLDLVVHRHDVTLYPGSEKLGFGLWNWTAPGIGVELAILFGGIWLYGRVTSAMDRTGTVSLAAFAALMGALEVSLAFTPPAMEKGLEWQVLAQLLFVYWALAIERHRVIRK
jgi:hypothetical protein